MDLVKDYVEEQRELMTRAQLEDPTVQLIRKWLANDHPNQKWVRFSKADFHDAEGILSLRDSTGMHGTHRIVLPKSMQKELMEEIHDNGAHFGRTKCIRMTERHAWWPTINADWTKKIGACKWCQTTKKSKVPSDRYGLMGKWPVTRPNQRIHVDHVGPFPKVKGFSMVLTIVDAFTRWVEFVPLNSKGSEDYARALLEHWIFVHGPPEQIVSDQGGAFISKVAQRCLEMWGIEGIRIQAYSQETNGTAERAHRWLNAGLKILVNNDQTKWLEKLPALLWHYRISDLDGTKISPFEMMYGRMPNTPLDFKMCKMRDNYRSDEEFTRTIQKNIIECGKIVKAQIIKKLETNRKNKNKLRIKPTMKKGDLVLLWRQQTKVGTCTRLIKPWMGPFILHSMEQNLAPQIKDPATGKIRSVCIRRLTPFVQDAEWTPKDELINVEDQVPDVVETKTAVVAKDQRAHGIFTVGDLIVTKHSQEEYRPAIVQEIFEDGALSAHLFGSYNNITTTPRKWLPSWYDTRDGKTIHKHNPHDNKSLVPSTWHCNDMRLIFWTEAMELRLVSLRKGYVFSKKTITKIKDWLRSD